MKKLTTYLYYSLQILAIAGTLYAVSGCTEAKAQGFLHGNSVGYSVIEPTQPNGPPKGEDYILYAGRILKKVPCSENAAPCMHWNGLRWARHECQCYTFPGVGPISNFDYLPAPKIQIKIERA